MGSTGNSQPVNTIFWKNPRTWREWEAIRRWNIAQHREVYFRKGYSWWGTRLKDIKEDWPLLLGSLIQLHINIFDSTIIPKSFNEIGL